MHTATLVVPIFGAKRYLNVLQKIPGSDQPPTLLSSLQVAELPEFFRRKMRPSNTFQNDPHWVSKWIRDQECESDATTTTAELLRFVDSIASMPWSATSDVAGHSVSAELINRYYTSYGLSTSGGSMMCTTCHDPLFLYEVGGGHCRQTSLSSYLPRDFDRSKMKSLVKIVSVNHPLGAPDGMSGAMWGPFGRWP
jgi:hypothetical protein